MSIDPVELPRTTTSPLRKAVSGSSLLEVMVAMAITAVFLSGLYALQWRCYASLKCAMEAAQGTRVLTTLAEGVRTSTWAQVTTAGTAVPTGSAPPLNPGVINILQNAGLPNSTLNNAQLTVDVNAYPPNGNVPTLEIVQSPQGACTVTKQPSNNTPTSNTLGAQAAVRVDLTVQWNTTFNTTQHTRMISLIVSQTGILGRYQ